MNTEVNYLATSIGLTDLGLVRKHNEDSIKCLTKYNTWVICDGMGGHSCGDVASQLAVDCIASAVIAGKSISDAVQYAHQSILSTAKNYIKKEGMGTTAIVLQLHNEDYEISWVGDSRAYLFDGKALTQLSTDHSLVQALVDSGSISQEQALNHPKKNIITQSLGCKKNTPLQVDSISGKLHHNQIIMLCSDGLSNELTDCELESEFLKTENINELANNLMSTAKSHGGSDNISIIVVKKNNVKENTNVPTVNRRHSHTKHNLFKILVSRAYRTLASVFNNNSRSS